MSKKKESIDWEPDFDEVRAMRSTITRLAIGLLEIAEQAMPTTFFETDKRCQFARKAIKQANKSK